MVADEYPPVLDAAMVSELLGMNIDTVRRLSREGILPAHRVPGGRTFKYLRDELLEWLAAQPANNPADATAEEDVHS
ncbi:MAG: helix-turn-helix domain-containing protein [Actinobacteria bacterium]|nr:helix-turn-helix domain-containing protein [Actinomycetota bacterium]MDP9021692.1 helix-turn-helix domain-containing protein [Actinomycetota bacterium]